MARKKLGELLLEAGVIDQTALRAALIEQRRWGGHLGRVLIDMKVVSEEQLVTILSRQLGIPTIDLDKTGIPQAVLDLVPADVAQQYSLIPFAQPMKFLDVAMTDPTNLGMIDELRIRTQLNVRPYLAGPRTLERAIARYYGRGFAPVGGGARDTSLELNTDAGGSMEIVRPTTGRGRATQPPFIGGGPPGLDDAVAEPDRGAEITALQERLSALEALVARDEDVLRKLLALLVEKGVATREEILERIR